MGHSPCAHPGHEDEHATLVGEHSRSRSLSRRGRLRVAIIGAGIGGLSCACTLKLFGVEVAVFESGDSIDDGAGGEIALQSANAVLTALGMPDAWSALREQSRSHRPNSVPVRALRRALSSQLERGTIRFGIRWVEHLGEEFDVIVDASGLGPPVADAHAAIGDARQARRPLGLDRLLFDLRRFRYGGDDALSDGLALGQRLGEAHTLIVKDQPRVLRGKQPLTLVRERLGEFTARAVKSPIRPTDARALRIVLASLAVSAAALVLGGVVASPGLTQVSTLAQGRSRESTAASCLVWSCAGLCQHLAGAAATSKLQGSKMEIT